MSTVSGGGARWRRSGRGSEAAGRRRAGLPRDRQGSRRDGSRTGGPRCRGAGLSSPRLVCKSARGPPEIRKRPQPGQVLPSVLPVPVPRLAPIAAGTAHGGRCPSLVSESPVRKARKFAGRRALRRGGGLRDWDAGAGAALSFRCYCRALDKGRAWKSRGICPPGAAGQGMPSARARGEMPAIRGSDACGRPPCRRRHCNNP